MNDSRSPEIYSLFGRLRKEQKGGQYLMSCSLIRKLTVQDRKMATKEVRKKERKKDHCFVTATKIRMEHF